MNPLRWSIKLAIGTSILLACSPAQAVIRLVVEQVGNDVVVTGSGSAITGGLNSAGDITDFTNVLTDSQSYAGPAAFADGSVTFWNGLSGPQLFGSDPAVTENPDQATSTGQLFGIFATGSNGSAQLVLPTGYSSGASLSGTSTFTSRTLAQLGFTSGQVFTWSWGSGATADRLNLEVNPVPAPLPMLLSAAFFSGISRLRRLSKRLHS